MTKYGSLYNIYVEKYDKAAKNAKKKGLPIADKYTKDQFKSMFESTKNLMIERGQSAKDTQVVKAMVDRNKFGTTTEAQGRSVYMAMKKRGYDVDIETIRAYYEYTGAEYAADYEELPAYLQKAGEPVKEFFDDIKTFYSQRKLEGYDATVIRQMIAQIYFDSP